MNRQLGQALLDERAVRSNLRFCVRRVG